MCLNTYSNDLTGSRREQTKVLMRENAAQTDSLGYQSRRAPHSSGCVCGCCARIEAIDPRALDRQESVHDCWTKDAISWGQINEQITLKHVLYQVNDLSVRCVISLLCKMEMSVRHFSYWAILKLHTYSKCWPELHKIGQRKTRAAPSLKHVNSVSISTKNYIPHKWWYRSSS